MAEGARWTTRLAGAMTSRVGIVVLASTVVVASGAVGYAIGGSEVDASVQLQEEMLAAIGDDGIPRAWIDSPSDGDVVPAGTRILNGHAAAVEGIASMTLEVNGERQHEPRSGATLEHVDWSYDARTPGEYTLVVWGTTTSGATTTRSSITVTVVGRGDLPTSTGSASPSTSASASATDQVSPAPTASPGATPTGSATPTPSASASASPTASATASPSATATPSATETATVGPTSTPTPSSSPTPTSSPAPTASPSPSPSPSSTPTACTPDAPSLVSPANGTFVIASQVELVWSPNGDCEPTQWQVQVATNAGFSSLVWNEFVPSSTTSWSPPSTPDHCVTFHWRVRGRAVAEANEPWSSIWSFTTDCG